VRRERVARLLALLLAAGVGVVGAWLGLAVAGRSSVTAGPFEVRAGVQFGSGLTEVALPPLGHLTAATHTAPLRLSFSLQDVRTGQLSDLLRDGGVDEVVTSMQKGLAARLVGLALRALGVALAGAIALAVLVYRKQWRMIGVAVSAALVVTGGSEVATRMTYQVSAFQRPAFSGSLVLAEQLIGPVRTAADRLEAFRAELGAVVAGAAKVYASIPATPVGAPDEIRVLHISDVHLSPLGIEFAERLASAFNVDFVLDTGDLTSFGTPPEELILNAIPDFGRPYVFVRGNHDSHALQDEMQRIPNAIVLDGATRAIDGITVYGLGDPAFTPDKRSVLNDAQFATVERAAGAVIRTEIGILPRPPDIVAVHDDRMAEDVAGLVPLVVSGHFHMQSSRDVDGTLFLRIGSTGGAGANVFTQTGGVPLSAEILHFQPGPPPVLIAYDVVTQSPETGSLTFERHLVQPEPFPSPTPSESFSPSPTPS
jgi:predicted phosphodiesterase